MQEPADLGPDRQQEFVAAGEHFIAHDGRARLFVGMASCVAGKDLGHGGI